MSPLQWPQRMKFTPSCVCLCFALTSMLEVIVLCMLILSFGIGSGPNQQVWWVSAVCVSLPVELVRFSSVTKLVLHNRHNNGALVNSNGGMLLPLVCLSFFIMPITWALCFLWLGNGEHDHKVWTFLMVFVKILLDACLCLIVTERAWLTLQAERMQNPGNNLQAQTRPPNLWVTPRSRLARLTLQTFIMDTHSSETVQAQECAICLNCPHAGETVTELHCNHTFHFSCIESWICGGGRGCPMRCEPPPISHEVDVKPVVHV